jgi:hypothetical protein
MSVRTSGASSGAYRCHGVAGPVAVVADHDAIGVQEVRDRGALLEELRAGHVAEPVLALLVKDPLDRAARADRDGRLHHQCVAVRRRHRVHDGVYSAEVGVARVGRRGADCHEQQARVLERVGDVRGEAHPPAVGRDQLFEPRLVDRDLALLQALDLVGVDVDAPDLGPQLGESCRRDEAHIAGADDPDGLPFGGHSGRGG